MANGEKDNLRKNCSRLPELMRTEIEVIRRYLSEHKKEYGLNGETETILNFIDEYGWLMREVYCGNICSYRNECEIAQPFLPNGDISVEVSDIVEQNGNGSPQLLEAEKSVLERHVRDHKYFRGINGMKEGVLDFLKQYGPVIEALFSVAKK